MGGYSAMLFHPMLYVWIWMDEIGTQLSRSVLSYVHVDGWQWYPAIVFCPILCVDGWMGLVPSCFLVAQKPPAMGMY